MLCSLVKYFLQVILKENADGTWTQETGLRTLTFPIDKEFEVISLHLICQPWIMMPFQDSWAGKVATGLVTLEKGTMVKTYKVPPFTKIIF